MTAAAPVPRLHEAVRHLPDLPAGDRPDPYTPQLLRDNTAEFAGLIGALAETADILRWGTLAAHHATLTSTALRSARWPLEDRRSINPVRKGLQEALEPNYLAAMALHDAAHHVHALTTTLGVGSSKSDR